MPNPSDVICYNPTVMPYSDLVRLVLAVAGEAVVLHCLSRILFVCVLGALAVRSHGGGWLVKFLRCPGNLVHEVGHAIGYLACGFRVKRLVLCVSDPKGRGGCAAGTPWLPLASPMVATAVAALCPLLIGALALRTMAQWLDPTLLLPLSAPREGLLLSSWDAIRDMLRRLDLHDWRTYTFIYLGFSIGAELSPSDEDFRRSFAPVLLVACLTTALVLLWGKGWPHSPSWLWFSQSLGYSLRQLRSLFGFAIMATGLVVAVTVGPALAWRAVRNLLRSRPPQPPDGN